ncbi:MAG: Hint domain-containing protein [Marinibacterium sp.]|nr:Hint domain-containing protein [Marinibacterium sp.]
MAEYFIPSGTPVIVFDIETGAFLRETIQRSDDVISNDRPSTRSFRPGDALSLASDADATAGFMGFWDPGPAQFPVITQQAAGVAMVLGADRSLQSFDQLGDLRIVNGPREVCFLEGTRIQTPKGPMPVEQLNAGDRVLNTSFSPCTVRWVARKTMSAFFGASDKTRPVCIRANAFGSGAPERDLYVTSDHGVMCNGALYRAGSLVNDASIDWAPAEHLGDSYDVYHVETAQHEIILAEGVGAESFADKQASVDFDNYATQRRWHDLIFA